MMGDLVAGTLAWEVWESLFYLNETMGSDLGIGTVGTR
jgi:hypothetical protein